ncbi:tumor necrosis factor receptor superfamily member 6B [Gadus morhua]|uniref:tumor necrosis factor receptor superfamily member 6B n=1 Tax=Gadus morhua TaxID=8049 RepID=UPI0011B60693|nr:tumor necrosis factor receptor superfamily member 6B-like [Gadus morhua]
MFLQMFALFLCVLPPPTNGFTTNGSTSLLTSLSTNGSTSWSTSPLTTGSTTYLRTDPDSGVILTCDRCAPGTYLHAPCTGTRKSACAACPPGSFTELWNYIEACIPCGACSRNQEVQRQCSAALDTACRCVAGHYHAPDIDMCIRHSTCPTGSGVVSQGTPTADTACQPCAAGSFSGAVSARDPCHAHTACTGGRGLQLLAGGAWYDSVCTSCEELRERESVDYLRDLLPGFLLHQNIPVSRLRLLLAAPLPGGEEPGELRLLLTRWALEAPPPALRKTLLRLMRGRHGRRLQSKLRRIEGRRREQEGRCGEE